VLQVEIKLKKHKTAKWNALERPENSEISPVSKWADSSNVDKSAYPTSSKKGPKAWDTIGAVCQRQQPEQTNKQTTI
jgi:hypothetical protein